MNLRGHVAIVTGASAGIGRAYALALVSTHKPATPDVLGPALLCLTSWP
jgi:hypothetical protein